MKLAISQRDEIRKRLAKGEKTTPLADEYGVSIPTIYAIKKEKQVASAPSAVQALESEIAQAEAEIAELEKAQQRIVVLKKQAEVKRQALEAIRKL